MQSCVLKDATLDHVLLLKRALATVVTLDQIVPQVWEECVSTSLHANLIVYAYTWTCAATTSLCGCLVYAT